MKLIVRLCSLCEFVTNKDGSKDSGERGKLEGVKEIEDGVEVMAVLVSGSGVGG